MTNKTDDLMDNNVFRKLPIVIVGEGTIFQHGLHQYASALEGARLARCKLITPIDTHSDIARTHHYASSNDLISRKIKDDNIPLDIWLKAGTPPNGRTKAQHILIKNLNKKKR